MSGQLSLFEHPFEHLTVEPTEAMRRGDQTIWQCSWCGCIVVIPGGKPQGPCPAGHRSKTTSWWEQRLPIAGVCQVRP